MKVLCFFVAIGCAGLLTPVVRAEDETDLMDYGSEALVDRIELDEEPAQSMQDSGVPGDIDALEMSNESKDADEAPSIGPDVVLVDGSNLALSEDGTSLVFGSTEDDPAETLQSGSESGSEQFDAGNEAFADPTHDGSA